MSDESADEPKPKRRPAWRRALRWLGPAFLIATSLMLLDFAGVAFGFSWTRYVRAVFGGGGAGMREQVRPGMSKSEVDARLGPAGETFVTICVCIAPGAKLSKPLPRTPYCRVSYPEYGFNVIYDCPDFIDQRGWTVRTIEDSN